MSNIRTLPAPATSRIRARTAARKDRRQQTPPQHLNDESRKATEKANAEQAFRIAQSERAEQIPCSLRTGTLAYKVMGLIIDAFPKVGEQHMSDAARFRAAVRLVVRQQLTVEERASRDVISHGIRIAEIRLNKAARQLNKEQRMSALAPSNERVRA